MSKQDKTVTIQLSAKNHFSWEKPFFQEGDKIKLARSSWWMARQRIKNKFMVHRLLRREYFPYMIVTAIHPFSGGQTLKVKPSNF